MGSSGDGEFTRRGVQEIESLRDVEFSRWDVHEIESSGDGEFTKWGLYQIGSSGVKLQVSNPCSLLRSKSTRHEKRCEAASEWLV